MQHKIKKHPQRVCMVCKKLKSKSELWRLVKTKDGKIEESFYQNKAGFGIYFCKNNNCINLFLKNKKFKSFLNKIEKQTIERIRTIPLSAGEPCFLRRVKS